MGEYACFTRPEFKVERISYPVMTPSAARGVLEAIFWKPEFRYEVRQIGILSLGGQQAILRNELTSKQK
ncbi:CRISPR-associated protein Cas5 [Geobacillus sp. BCO2]|nr:CRISPR-associated protein Cas5 [Geobacillus sp. BCO2]